VKRTSLLAGAAALATTAALALVSPAQAVPGYSAFSYFASAGATQVQALGVTVQSDPTAQSVVTGNTDQHAQQKIASAKVGTLLAAGVATTDATATVDSSKGVSVVAHAHTAGVNLLGGLIKISAIDTYSTITADPGTTPTANMTTQLLGLTINGKSYPANINPNTGLTIPGVVSILINQQQVATSDDSATVLGAGLKVTLLGSRNGASAGAMIAVNPITNVVQPGNGEVKPGYGLGGAAYGAYVTANVGGQIQAETGKIAMVTTPAQGTEGKTLSNSTAKAYLAGVLNLGAITSSTVGIRSDALSQATDTSTIANLSLFGGLIQAKALSATSTAAATPTGGSVSGGLTFVKLVIAGKTIPVNVAPNTTIHVLNLGRVTINEQTPVVNNGVVHAFRTIGLHIVLDTRRAGLPVGADVQVAFAQSQVYH
jgi:hypothetical protein